MDEQILPESSLVPDIGEAPLAPSPDFPPAPLDPAPFVFAPFDPAPESPLLEPPANVVRMVESPEPETQAMVEETRSCAVCGRSFDALAVGQKCESRANLCSLCCPHPACRANSAFREDVDA